MKKDVFNKATKLSNNITMLDQVINSSNNLKHPNLNSRGLFSSSY